MNPIISVNFFTFVHELLDKPLVCIAFKYINFTKNTHKQYSLNTHMVLAVPV